MNKIISYEDTDRWAESVHNNGKTIVFTNGCFDIIHYGHIVSFKKAKETGADYLVVAINSDKSVKKIKGPLRPIVDEQNRAKLLEAIETVDKIVIFDDEGPWNLIKKIKPDFVIKGIEWKNTTKGEKDRITVEKYGGKMIYINLEEGLSTTNIIEKIIKSYCKDV